MGQVPAVRETHAEDGVPRSEHRHVHRGVGLTAGVRLHVRELRPEERLGAVDRQLLGHVDILAAAVVALARIAFRVLVGEDRTLRLQHPRTRVVLRGNQLDVVFLPLHLGLHRSPQVGVETFDNVLAGKHGRLLQSPGACPEF